MKTYNFLYSNTHDLEQFIQDKNFADGSNLLIQLFSGECDEDYINTLIDDLVSQLPKVKLIGATTDGAIFDATVSEFGTVMTFMVFESTRIQTYHVPHNDDSYVMGTALATKVGFDEDTKVLITFADGIRTNGERYLNAFDDFQSNYYIAGGLAADHATFNGTYIFTEQGCFDGGAVGATLTNADLILQTHYSFGWENIGKMLTVTKSVDNRVYTIDDIVATEVYKHYLGEEIEKLLPETGIEFPLIINRNGLKVARAVLMKHDDGSLSFAGNINVGDQVQFGYGNIEEILTEDFHKPQEVARHPIEGIFIYSCMARKRLMGENIVTELHPLASLAPTSGFFTYGEFFHQKGQSELLNQTMTILTLSEHNDSFHHVGQPLEQVKQAGLRTVKALSHLVSVTSAELQEINAHLDAKVQLEVEKNLEQEKLLHEQSRLAQMGEMISMIAHQWRQPLANVGVVSDTILNKVRLNRFDLNKIEDQQKCLTMLDTKLSKIGEYVQFMSSTIDDFRNFFKPGKQQERVQVQALNKKALGLIHSSLITYGIEVKEEIIHDQIIHTFPNEVMQVLLNIYKNAIDNFREKEVVQPVIRTVVDVIDTKTVITICDNGGGIPNEYIINIFDPYFSTKDEKNGTRLGLYMSKVMVEEHCNGILHVHNSEEGACFTITLPSR
jgi:hypothetical protein